MGWVFLSYELSDKLSGYGNGDRIQIDRIRNMTKGDSSNNSFLHLPSHFGTHIDFPKHFVPNGKTGSDYQAARFVFQHISFLDIQSLEIPSYLICPEHLKGLESNQETEILVLKTGFGAIRNSEDYWLKNWGMAPESAGFLKSVFPNLKAIMFDLMSLTSYQERMIGRAAHQSFLGDHDLLIIEDCDLSLVNASTQWKQMIVSPLRFEDSDGTPVTIFAEIND